MGIYIHIPFCNSICSYCDFCKILYDDKLIYNYLSELSKEIKNKYKNELVKSIYIGGGTPTSLNIEDLSILLSYTKHFNVSKEIEFTVECNIESITEEKLLVLKKYGVNRLSIGIQTFNQKHLKYLNRKHLFEDAKKVIDRARKLGFNNINVDIIYAIPNQTKEEIEIDLNKFLQLNTEHISAYSLMIEPHTMLYINGESEIDEELDFDMYNLIERRLTQNGYKHYEISNYAKEGYHSKHNLNYWNNSEYYGFGLGASGYINGTRYENTKSINNYLNGKYLLNEKKLTEQEKLENEFILGLRKFEGINKRSFNEKYNMDINKIKIVNDLLNDGKLLESKGSIYINSKYIYTSNDILINFID